MVATLFLDMVGEVGDRTQTVSSVKLADALLAKDSSMIAGIFKAHRVEGEPVIIQRTNLANLPIRLRVHCNLFQLQSRLNQFAGWFSLFLTFDSILLTSSLTMSSRAGSVNGLSFEE